MEIDSVKLYFGTDDRSGVVPLEPEILHTPLSELNKVDGKPYISHSWSKKRLLMEEGYIVQPNDCPPIRNINSYGFQFFASGHSVVVRHSERQCRCTRQDHATNGFYSHYGDRCDATDSGFLTSWLANSSYFKVVTGLVVYCPTGFGLYQSGLPCGNNSKLSTLSAIEYGNSMGIFLIDGKKYFMVEVNLVCSIDSGEIQFDRGDVLGVFYPVMGPARFSINRLDSQAKPTKIEHQKQ